MRQRERAAVARALPPGPSVRSSGAHERRAARRRATTVVQCTPAAAPPPHTPAAVPGGGVAAAGESLSSQVRCRGDARGAVAHGQPPAHCCSSCPRPVAQAAPRRRAAAWAHDAWWANGARSGARRVERNRTARITRSARRAVVAAHRQPRAPRRQRQRRRRPRVPQRCAVPTGVPRIGWAGTAGAHAESEASSGCARRRWSPYSRRSASQPCACKDVGRARGCKRGGPKSASIGGATAGANFVLTPQGGSSATVAHVYFAGEANLE